jgi:hypothetical protein
LYGKIRGSSVQNKKKEIFDILAQEFSNDAEELAEIWIATNEDIKQEHQNLLLEIIDNLPEKSYMATKLWNESNEDFTEDSTVFEKLIQNIDKNMLQKQIEKIKATYSELSNANPKLKKTINLGIFDEKITSNLGTSQLVKLTVYPDLQEKIIKNIEKPQFISIMQYVCNNTTNWIIGLNGVMNNIEKYKNLLDNINVADLNEEKTMQNLIKVISGEENYFNITNIEQIRNFDEIRRNFCYDILEEKISKDLPKCLQELSPEQRETFAMLELSFGLDIAEAENLVYKYGEDIEELEGLTKEEEEIRDTITAIKLILNADDNKKIYQDNILQIREWMEGIEPASIATLEAKTLNMYSRLYKESIGFQEEEIEIVNYEGKEVRVSEITSDFNIFIRSEGAYSSWEEPEDFSEDTSNERMPINGKCTCYIGQNLIGVARPRGPMLGYKNPHLLLMAPWDIVSNEANVSFSPSRCKMEF